MDKELKKYTKPDYYCLSDAKKALERVWSTKSEYHSLTGDIRENQVTETRYELDVNIVENVSNLQKSDIFVILANVNFNATSVFTWKNTESDVRWVRNVRLNKKIQKLLKAHLYYIGDTL